MRIESPDYVVLLAKQMRRNPTPAEDELWERLRRKALGGHKFHRQFPIGRYILDFYCPAASLAIEVGGSAHENERQQLLDWERTKLLGILGIRVLRFSNDEVLTGIGSVLSAISVAIDSQTYPSHSGGEG